MHTRPLEDGEVTVSLAEIADAPYSSQIILKIIMEKGAPVIGCCTLTLDARYRWFVEEDKATKTVAYSWKVKD